MTWSRRARQSMALWTRFDRPEYAESLDRRPLHPEMAASLDGLLELGGSEKVLEVGTGTGRVAVRVFPKVPTGQFIGLDPSPTLLGWARQKLNDTDNARLIRGVAESLPVRDGAVDVVVFANVLHHLGDPSAALREARRVVKDGGRLVILDPVLREARDELDMRLHRFIEDVFRRTHGPQFRFWTLSELHAVIEHEGFAVATAREVTLMFDGEPLDRLSKSHHWRAAWAALADEPRLRERFEIRYFRLEGEPPRVTGAVFYAAIGGMPGLRLYGHSPA